MNKADILNRALSHVTKDRNATHGDAFDQLSHTARYWSIYLGVEITAEQVSMCQVLMKISRTKFGTLNPDDYEDLCGYGAIAGECRDKLEHPENHWGITGYETKDVRLIPDYPPGKVMVANPDGSMEFVDPPKDAIGDL